MIYCVLSQRIFVDLTITFTDCYKYPKQYWTILVIIVPIMQIANSGPILDHIEHIDVRRL